MDGSPEISPFLWFDKAAEEAAEFYVSVFPNSKIESVQRYPENAGVEEHGHEPGGVMTVSFSLSGHAFTAINGGPHVTLNEVISFVVDCADQAEIDHYWGSLSEGGPPEAQQCGWLKDKFGLSWQIVPAVLPDLLEAAGGPVMKALLGMRKLDLAALEAARDSAGA